MKSFINALSGITHAVKTERNMRIHISAVFYVIIAGLLLDIDHEQWAMIAIACGMVLGAELINTALERLCDGLEPGHSPVIKAVKDLAAGAVLLCAITAIGVAVVVFSWPVYVYFEAEAWSVFLGQPLFWVGLAALPLWVLFIVFGGRRL